MSIPPLVVMDCYPFALNDAISHSNHFGNGFLDGFSACHICQIFHDFTIDRTVQSPFLFSPFFCGFGS
jgi:hypothetical protein